MRVEYEFVLTEGHADYRPPRAGETDFGGIDSFAVADEEFSFKGDFGKIRLSNEETVSVAYFSDSSDIS